MILTDFIYATGQAFRWTRKKEQDKFTLFSRASLLHCLWRDRQKAVLEGTKIDIWPWIATSYVVSETFHHNSDTIEGDINPSLAIYMIWSITSWVMRFPYLLRQPGKKNKIFSLSLKYCAPKGKHRTPLVVWQRSSCVSYSGRSKSDSAGYWNGKNTRATGKL